MEYDNHDGIQLGSKYIYFPVPRGETPAPKTYNEALADCQAHGGEMAYPSDEAEDDAVKVRIIYKTMAYFVYLLCEECLILCDFSPLK